MAGIAFAAHESELIVEFAGELCTRVPLVLPRYRVGRGSSNQIAFPQDARLSREHMELELIGDQWHVRDLGSRNGTRLNGHAVSDATRLRDGDELTAGNLTLLFRGSDAETLPNATMTVDTSGGLGLTAVSTDLESALRTAAKPESLQSNHLNALLQAGRELAGYRDLDGLFDLILNLAVNAVKAARGMLMLNENGSLRIRSSQGENLNVSTAVSDRVLRGESLLIEDIQDHQGLAQRHSILASNVRSILTVPLQTDAGILGLIYLDTPYHVRRFTQEDLSVLTVLSNIAAVRIEHARLLEVEQAERQLARELDHAAEIQSRLLPSHPPASPRLDLAGHNAACRKVGGDYYDFWTYADGRTLLLIADVSGKGMPAALMMSNLQACVHVLFEQPGDLTARVSQLNRYVASNTPSNAFVTFFIAVIDPIHGHLTYCNAGHNAPLLVRSGGDVERLDPTGMVLGLIPQTPYGEGRCIMSEGDLLLLYSDGVSEACAPGTAEEFGEDRLVDVLRTAGGVPAVEAVDRIRLAVDLFTKGAAAADDVTLVAARRI
jgi:phosphoserine phosphatase RsbU/P